MFEFFDFVQRDILYRALLHSVKTNQGHGFHNDDQGHPAYRLGTQTGEGGMGDTPKDNAMFRMMRELSLSIESAGEFRKEDIVASWQDFCRLATEGYDRYQGKKP
jgi:hypothetical protein